MYVSFEDLHKLFFKSDNVRFAFAQHVRNVCASMVKKKNTNFKLTKDATLKNVCIANCIL